MTGDAPQKQVYSVAELNLEIQRALQTAFPGAVWVRGEIQRLAPDAARRTHNYFELHGTTATGAAVAIPVALLDWDRQRYGLGRYLDGRDPDLQLANKLEVCLQCVVDFYPPFGKLQLKLVGVDAGFTLGQLEARRRAVLEYLKSNGLLELNAARPMPRLPLRIGLITSRGSAAEKDFLTELQDSGFGFQVLAADCRMMGESMQAQIIAAIADLSVAGVDVLVITRGGGSRADLSWFDQQDLAVAIARAPVPVITAIGHEIDHSIADVVAHHALKTPTAAAQDLIGTLQAAEDAVDDVAHRLSTLAEKRLSEAQRRLERAGSRLQPVVLGAMRQWDGALVNLRDRVFAVARSGLALRQQRLDRRVDQLQRGLAARFRTASLKLEHQQQKLQLLDPDRLLRRGWSLTLDTGGRVLRSVDDVQPGMRLVTRLLDGRVESTVDKKHEDGKGTS